MMSMPNIAMFIITIYTLKHKTKLKQQFDTILC